MRARLGVNRSRDPSIEQLQSLQSTLSVYLLISFYCKKFLSLINIKFECSMLKWECLLLEKEHVVEVETRNTIEEFRWKGN